MAGDSWSRALDALGRIALPAELRDLLHLREGDSLVVAAVDDVILLTPRTTGPSASGAETHAPRLIGLSESAAIAIATAKGFSVTIYTPGVIPRSYGRSFDPSRIQLTIEDGIVTRASVH